MLNDFIDWAKSVVAKPCGEFITVRLTVGSNSANPSARLDVDTPFSVARITYWDSNDFEAEVIDLDSEKQIYSQYGKFRPEAQLSTQFQPFFDVL
ncbi:MAG: hypothetical protein GZ090_07450 [Oxalobacteraceae bacterium]|nr:hypothetical protein [Oxalobacteraceae bacterium]